MALNPIFNEKVIKPKSPATSTPQPKQRKTRSDKCHDIKFPVTPEERAALRTLAKQRGVTVTRLATELLLDGLQRQWMIDHSLPYKDTKQYMHVKPIQIYYHQVEQLAIEWGISERRAVHRIVISVLRYVLGGKVHA